MEATSSRRSEGLIRAWCIYYSRPSTVSSYKLKELKIMSSPNFMSFVMSRSRLAKRVCKLYLWYLSMYGTYLSCNQSSLSGASP